MPVEAWFAEVAVAESAAFILFAFDAQGGVAVDAFEDVALILILSTSCA